MGKPETRTVDRCVYTPVVNNAKIGDERPGFRAALPHHKLNLLGLAFADPGTREALAAQLKKHAHEFQRVLPALRAVDEGDLAGAAALVAPVELDGVVALCEEALGLQRLAMARISGAVDTLLEAGPEKAPPAEPDDPAPATQVALGQLLEQLGKQAPGSPELLRHFDLLPRHLLPITLDVEDMRQAVTAGRLQLDARAAAFRSVKELAKLEPIGFLHLERLSFTPVDYAQGELVYSLPLLPGETVRLTHREWSRTEQEYAEVVATSLETASQELLSEKSELAESATTQQQRTSAFSANFSASGGFGPMQISTAVGYNTTNSDSRSRTSSAKHAQEITKSASARSKREHKLTFRVSTQYEIEEQSFREITNSSDEAVRWDFHRLLKRWQVDLYRYDIRLTYDLVVPEPGSFLLRKHAELREVERRLRKPFRLLVRSRSRGLVELRPRDITPRNYDALEARFKVRLDPPPQEISTSGHAEQTFTEPTIGWDYVELAFPQGYEIIPDSVQALPTRILVEGSPPREVTGYIDTERAENLLRLRGPERGTNVFLWRYGYDWSQDTQPPKGSVLSIIISARAEPTDEALQAWRDDSFQRILDAAKVAFEADRQALTVRRDQLIAEIARDEDALTLRRIEREEITKAVIRWLQPPGVRFYPGGEKYDLDVDQADDLDFYQPGSGALKGGVRDRLLAHGRMVKFVHHAIEWESVNYILYPYLWTDPDRWDFKQAIVHKDPEHRAFLRAGAARIVLTIRPGFEDAFLAFMETGKVDESLPKNHVYLSVAEELRAYARTTYPYTPGANEEDYSQHVATWFEFTPTGALDVTRGGQLDS